MLACDAGHVDLFEFCFRFRGSSNRDVEIALPHVRPNLLTSKSSRTRLDCPVQHASIGTCVLQIASTSTSVTWVVVCDGAKRIDSK